MVVYKYPVPVDDYFTLELPLGARPLHVAEQHGQLWLWAMVDPDRPTWSRRFRFAGTSHPIKERADQLRFISTVLLEGGTLVFHFFEILDPKRKATND